MTSPAKSAACLLLAILVSAGAYAAFDKPEEAIEYRQAVMHLVGHQLKELDAVVKGDVAFEKAAFAATAGVLKMLATLPWEAMTTPGTDKGKTTLSPDVFEKGDDFNAKAADFENAAAQLADAADLDAARERFGAVAASCKSCHSRFRTR